jgi:hypothetical protein
MTEGYGYGYRDEPGGGSDTRPSGRGAVAERRAGQDEEAREIDLTDEAADREAAAAAAREADAGEDERGAVAAASAPGAEAGEALPSDRESSGSFEPHPAGVAPAAAGTSIFDVGRDEGDEGAAPAAADAGAEPAEPEAAAAEPAAPAALDADGIRNRFLDIQAGFVDEPRQAVEEAGRFVEEVAQQVIDALQAQRGQLQVPVADASTEDLRLAMRSYRQFIDRLLGLGL